MCFILFRRFFYLRCCFFFFYQANKISDDYPYTHINWAASTNLSLPYLNSCEKHILGLLNYNINIRDEEYELFENRLFSDNKSVDESKK
jgi:hypothetical protein